MGICLIMTVILTCKCIQLQGSFVTHKKQLVACLIYNSFSQQHLCMIKLLLHVPTNYKCELVENERESGGDKNIVINNRKVDFYAGFFPFRTASDNEFIPWQCSNLIGQRLLCNKQYYRVIRDWIPVRKKFCRRNNF